MNEIVVTETTVWHQGKPLTFKDEREAAAWVDEIVEAREQKRPPNWPSQEKLNDGS